MGSGSQRGGRLAVRAAGPAKLILARARRQRRCQGAPPEGPSARCANRLGRRCRPAPPRSSGGLTEASARWATLAFWSS
eukprot:3394897-Pyramimonas_sp.AAC.1